MITSDIFSARLSVQWDWSNNSSSGKQSRTQEAFKYSPRRLAQVDNVESDYPFDVVDTRLRVPGSGRTMVVRYESSPGKDFILLGHSITGIETTESEARK